MGAGLVDADGAVRGLRARLLGSVAPNGAPACDERSDTRAYTCLEYVHICVFVLSVLLAGTLWGCAGATLCYHFAWSSSLCWLCTWAVPRLRRARAHGYLYSSDDDPTRELLASARRAGPERELTPGSDEPRAPTATVYVTVFTEPFEQVLQPTIEQALRVVRFYNRLAAAPDEAPRANLVVLDDGLQLVPDAERGARLGYYHAHGIAYIARPRDGEGGFVREGFFKKAGNLNFAHTLSALARATRPDISALDGAHVEHARAFGRGRRTAAGRCCEPDGPEGAWCSIHGVGKARLCARARAPDPAATAAPSRPLHAASPEQLARAAVHGVCGLGQYVLLLDNDSWAPESALVDSVRLLQRAPDAAYLQHVSAPLNEAE